MNKSFEKQQRWSSIIVHGVLIIICLIWTIPTLGTLITSFRHGDATKNSGWWTAFSNPDFTLSNYQQAISGREIEIVGADGERQTVRGKDMSQAFINSLTVTIPSVIIPILVAAFAAYGFAWIEFPGRKFFFTAVIALMVVPLQIALVPILRDYKALNLNGTWLAIWLAHTGFGLTTSVYLLFNYINSLPRDILESAFIDGASHFTIFTRLILPLSVPAIASLAIFQFLWVWNDFLVATVFLGTRNEVMVLTQYLQSLIGERASDWHLLTAGAFITMIVPLIVFFSLQRFFVRGMLAGSVKG
jgi:alpha-glucoside transport system permease protein